MNRDSVIRYKSMQHALCSFNFGGRACHMYKAHGFVESYIISTQFFIYMDIPHTKKPTATERYCTYHILRQYWLCCCCS